MGTGRLTGVAVNLSQKKFCSFECGSETVQGAHGVPGDTGCPVPSTSVGVRRRTTQCPTLGPTSVRGQGIGDGSSQAPTLAQLPGGEKNVSLIFFVK